MDDPLKGRKMDEIFHSNRKMSILLNLSKVLHQVVECKNKMLLRESTFQGDQSGIKYFHPRNLSRNEIQIRSVKKDASIHPARDQIRSVKKDASIHPERICWSFF